jgi:acyl carrier protein
MTVDSHTSSTSATSQQALCGELIRYFSVEVLEGQDIGLDDSTPLLDMGLLNSVELLKLLAFMDERFSLTVPPEELLSHNLKDVASISQMIARLLSRPAA